MITNKILEFLWYLIDLVKKAVVDASTTFRDDQLDAYNRAIETETND